ncbi:peptidylprolyl isomerase [Thalassotalea fonticola]|uniref:Peptidyl-prolyl cis-trans isomerase n=1 Tax=Thalassotalea fonticola TaxID=3065649 RepID=A0ABZ0GK24_9GAMM|nr:peptidylprolyl isomerase [Colwelliaceae bacterium S1-1]
MMKFINLSLTTSFFVGLLTLSMPSNATIVLFETNMGDFEVNLLDNDTPKTVANFLKYVEAKGYSNAIVHRSMPGFITQGGGFTYNTETTAVEDAMLFASVVNEPVFSNVRGTIAMAKKGTDENSATNQWFFNGADNAANLDNQNGGFTVFGVVTGDGMEIIDAINDLPTYSIQGLSAFTDTPLQTEPTGNGITDEHYVIIESITVVNANQDTQPALPPLSTAKEEDDSDSSGGSNGLYMLGLLALVRLFRRS